MQGKNVFPPFFNAHHLSSGSISSEIKMFYKFWTPSLMTQVTSLEIIMIYSSAL